MDVVDVLAAEYCFVNGHVGNTDYHLIAGGAEGIFEGLIDRVHDDAFDS